jgi:hypothetical protein
MGAIKAKPIRDVIATCVASAWSPTVCYIGDPLTYPENSYAFPYAFIQTDSVTKVPGSVQSWRARYEFTIIGRFAMPSTGTVEDAKETKANALYDAMINSSLPFSGVCDLHNISSVSFQTLGERDEQAFEVTVTFYAEREEPRF